jgi:3-dehydroquinate synthase
MSPLSIVIPPRPGRSYPVRTCQGARVVAARLASIAGGAKVLLVTDPEVRRLHGHSLEASLRRHSVDFTTFTFPRGERSKSRSVRDLLEDRMIRAGAERSSVVAAFGGGVVGDLAGFVASTLFRGVRLVQVPTTLVAQVDSAIGGKVGIDHPLGKNLLGSFHHPAAVLVNPAYLQTLPEREYLQGLAEVLKTAIILDRRLAGTLRRSAGRLLARDRAALSPVVARCCTLKGKIVTADERESGERRLLNFGHTIGHAIERVSGFRVPHGFAVSIGMAVEAGIAGRLGLISAPELASLLGLIESYGLPLAIPRALSRAEILRATTFDKKKSGGVVGFTLPTGVGTGVCGIGVPGGVLSSALGL